MPFLRLSIFLVFFAFSFAGADCNDKDDFEIFANEVSLGCGENVSTEITYGDTLTFTVSPPDTGIYTWTTSIGTIIGTGSSYSPKFSVSENPSPDVIETYKVRRKDGLTKTIDVTIMGRETYTVSFDTNEDDDMTEIEEQEVMKDSLATEPKDSLTKEGYYFGGWDFDFENTPIIKDTTIKAIWRVKAYLVYFDTDGGTPSIIPQIVVEKEFAKEPKETLTRTGYNFDGWNFDFEKTPITKDTTIKAKWKISNLFVGDTIIFEDPGYDIDSIFSSKQRHYFVFSPSLCEVKDTIKIQITTKEPDIILRIDSIPQRSTDENGLHYEVPFIFKNKPGLDTLIYEWISKDGLRSKFDTILIETPIPFDSIVKQKWNSVLFVNNNSKKFKDFEWFKNNNEVGNLQFYSIVNYNSNDIYKIVMQTTEGNRISTCEGKAKINITQPPKPTLTKQVLGIKEKYLNKNSKVYNLNGKLIKETSAGVYIVKEE
ncbi:MAG: InlB B-repeat-containing protein [Fibromonadaceae bacterium]|jgi:hypothetical protein|nr:InlB B-repeat-containing protein [Fibromonadaceae bacterium]